MLQILQVQLNLGSYVVYRRIIRAVDLRPTGNSRSCALTQWVQLDILPQLGENARPFWPRSNDVHVAQDDIDELRQLIEPSLSQKVAYPSYPRVAARCPDWTRSVLCVHPHRAELDDPEGTPTRITPPTLDIRAACTAPSVPTHASLHIKHRPARCQLDCECHQRHDRRKEYE